ncbi:MAG: hypothetical protein OEZ48_11460 [Candidatus Bathyarchaeota archaeon]|nr:hypothetical protein [Candidatus Bathyarchaeota archaeon]
MKTWKFVALWAFILISGELILYGRYYILFYKPYIPFKLVRAEVYWDGEIITFQWYFTIQYVGNDTLEDVRITWADIAFCKNITVIEEKNGKPTNIMFSDCKRTEHIKQLVYADTFIVSSSDSSHVVVEMTYRKAGLETEVLKMGFSTEDAQKIILHGEDTVELTPEEWKTPESYDPLSFKKPEAHARAAIFFPQILAVISLLIGAVLMSYFVIEITAKRSR